jgi:hypothetical protein
MYTNVNLAAPVGVLLFLGTGLLLFLTALTLVYSVIAKKFGLAKLLMVTVAAIVGLYLVAMLIFSFAGSEKVLAHGQEKHFCEIDCHLAYSVIDVREIKTLGDAPHQLTAAGTFRVVTIQTRFDETTIGPTRGNGPLYPNSRALVVMDQTGKQYFPSTSANNTLESSQQDGTPITTPLRPGETYATTVAFDLPAGVHNPTLLIHEGESVTAFVIGHENSLLHKKTRFQI